MKFSYSEPTIEVFLFDAPDVLRASGVTTPSEPSMGEDVVGVAGSDGSNIVW